MDLLTSTPVQKFDDVLSCGDSGFVELRGGPASHEAVQISARELLPSLDPERF